MDLNIFDFEAHRGGRDARPENTLYSYAYAMASGCSTIECDMQLTADRRIVMSHNPILNPDITQDRAGHYVPVGKYDIRRMNTADVQSFNVGRIRKSTDYFRLHGRYQIPMDVCIPTLDELFDLADDAGDTEICFNLETKTFPCGPESACSPDPGEFVSIFLDTVKRHKMENRVILQSFDWRTLKEMKKLDASIPLSALWEPAARSYGCASSPWLAGLSLSDFHGEPVLAAHALGCHIFSPDRSALTMRQISLAHSLSMKVLPWTVNEEKNMDILIDTGADGLITDRPWVLKAVLERRSLSVRTPTIHHSCPFYTGTSLRNSK